jgi:uncharacterized protein YceK
MADFSNIDVEKLVVAWEEEDDSWNIWRGKLKSFYSYLDLPFSALLVRHDVLLKHFFVLSKVLFSSSS